MIKNLGMEMMIAKLLKRARTMKNLNCAVIKRRQSRGSFLVTSPPWMLVIPQRAAATAYEGFAMCLLCARRSSRILWKDIKSLHTNILSLTVHCSDFNDRTAWKHTGKHVSHAWIFPVTLESSSFKFSVVNTNPNDMYTHSREMLCDSSTTGYFHFR